MTTRKPKTIISPLIEWPTEQLQVVPVTVEHKAPARAGQTISAGWTAIDGAQQLEVRPACDVVLKGAGRPKLN